MSKLEENKPKVLAAYPDAYEYEDCSIWNAHGSVRYGVNWNDAASRIPVATGDWTDDEAVVRAAEPTANCFERYSQEKTVGWYVGTGRWTDLGCRALVAEAWKWFRENNPTVQSFERIHDPAHKPESATPAPDFDAIRHAWWKGYSPIRTVGQPYHVQEMYQAFADGWNAALAAKKAGAP